MSFKSAALAIMLALVCLPAMAQTPTTGTSSATNALTVNTFATTGSGTPLDANGNPLPTTSNVHYSGTTQAYTTPNVQGSYFAGANPCLIGIGASGAGGPVGLSFTFGKNDEGCDRRSDAAAWHALGLDVAAQARMCQDRDNADAFFAATGKVCPGSDPKRYAAQLAALQQVHPAPVLVAAVAPPAPAKPVVSPMCQGLDPRKKDDQPYYLHYKCGTPAS